MKSLKNKKSCGLDGISNEMLKHSSSKLKDAILKLFNIVLKSGHFPEIWKENLITPIFKQGEKYDPNNYEALQSAVISEKLFCSIINDRLVQFIQEHKILNNCQIGFMPKQRTSDHIYTLHTLIQKIRSTNKTRKIFGCFIDFQKAFDSVWHNGLFLKLIQGGIGGRTYDIIKDIYNGTNAMSRSTTDGLIISVKPKESVKAAASARLYLISILMNWHQHLISPLVLVWPSRAEKSNASCMQTIFCCCRLMKRGCTKASPFWKSTVVIGALPINMEKSKIMIFQKKPRLADKKYEFTIGGTILNHVTCYNYLGLTISASGQFNTAIKDLTDKARRAFYSIRRPLFKFNPPIKLWLKIFDSIIKPILLYGSEIWGPKFKLKYETWDKNPVEIFHLEFCKNILGIHRNAPNLGCRAELGRFPLLSEIQRESSEFWFHLSDTPTDSYHHSAFTIGKNTQRVTPYTI